MLERGGGGAAVGGVRGAARGAARGGVRGEARGAARGAARPRARWSLEALCLPETAAGRHFSRFAVSKVTRPFLVIKEQVGILLQMKQKN